MEEQMITDIAPQETEELTKSEKDLDHPRKRSTLGMIIAILIIVVAIFGLLLMKQSAPKKQVATVAPKTYQGKIVIGYVT